MKHVKTGTYQQHIPLMAVFSAILVVAALGLNAVWQSHFRAAGLVSRAAFAVFLAAEPAVSSHTVVARLEAIGGISRIEYVGRDTVYENAARPDSPLRDLLTAGQNPFSSYLLVYPAEPTPAVVRTLSDLARKTDGVTDVRYDEPLFSAAADLTAFERFYRTVLWIVVVVLVLIAAFRETNNLILGMFDPRAFGALLVRGAVAGAAAMGGYAALVWYCGAPSPVMLSLRWLSLLVPLGMALSVAVGEKR